MIHSTVGFVTIRSTVGLCQPLSAVVNRAVFCDATVLRMLLVEYVHVDGHVSIFHGEVVGMPSQHRNLFFFRGCRHRESVMISRKCEYIARQQKEEW